MSTQKGNTKKPGQRHQNTYAFKHNKNSMLTRKIQEAPLDKLCQHCLNILEWKLKYRKYKPLTTPGVCRLCNLKNVLKGHRTVCDACSLQYMVCSKCIEPCKEFSTPNKSSKHLRNNIKDSTFDEIIEVLKERQRRTILRRKEKGEQIIFHGEKGFINANTGEVVLGIEEINADLGGEGNNNDNDDNENLDEKDDDDCDDDDEREDLDDDLSENKDKLEKQIKSIKEKGKLQLNENKDVVEIKENKKISEIKEPELTNDLNKNNEEIES